MGGNLWKVGLKFNNAGEHWNGQTEERPLGQLNYEGLGTNPPKILSAEICNEGKLRKNT